ncbi:vesicular inhibitory amino acid transporter-like [Clytia hemisphaerica]|uniref:vesicular inhibitory amino acid transporter-like n=1 Tax=Clytia hemisphaerica TaxID=252671 RepID=UPI0034D6E288|eukprot:TCONS_00071123-protein
MSTNSVYHDGEFEVPPSEATSLLCKNETSNGYCTISCEEKSNKEEENFFMKSTSSIDSGCEEHEINQSQISHRSILATLVEKVSEDNKAPLFLTIFTILPVLQGSAVLGVPYAFLVGGKAFLPAALFICVIATICSNLLIDSLYEVSPRSQRRKRVYDGYEDLALACWGRFGSHVVKAMTILYFAMNNVVNMVLLFKSLDNLLHGLLPITTNELGYLFVLLLLPILFGVRRFSIFGYFGLIGTVAVLIACITSIVVFIQHSGDWATHYHELPTIDWERYPVAISIMMYTVIIAPTLPNIEATMTDRSQAPASVYISFGISSIFKSIYGIIAVLTFGLSTKELIATNVSELSIPSRYIMSIMLIVYVFCNSSYFIYLMLDIIDQILIKNVSGKIASGERYRIPWMLFSRPLCLVILVVTSLVMPFFALVSGVVGAICGSFLAFISPVLFHLKLKWNNMSLLRRVMEILLLILTILLGSLTTFTSMNELIKAIRIHHDV